MELVGKWETEEKITEANRNNIARYFELLDCYRRTKETVLRFHESGGLPHQGS